MTETVLLDESHFMAFYGYRRVGLYWSQFDPPYIGCHADWQVVNLDRLTCAGNPDNLSGLPQELADWDTLVLVAQGHSVFDSSGELFSSWT
jgi:hypothetical protein